MWAFIISKVFFFFVFFFSSRRRHTRFDCDWSSDVCSSDLFQEFFVREHWQPDVRSVSYSGAGEARAPEAVLHSIRESRLVIIAPSNPITSIGPMLAIHDIRDALRCTRAEVIAISPLIGNTAFAGPAAKLMEACGYEVSPSGVARCYHDFLDNIVIDVRDAALASSIRYETIGVQVTDILMSDDEAARRLAE